MEDIAGYILTLCRFYLLISYLHEWDLLKGFHLAANLLKKPLLLCCFQEWVTDSPFIISPRITFEVSVRLLGGLMALGYTIAAILKRSSHVFHDDKVSIKTDWLEQLNRLYVQVYRHIIHTFPPFLFSILVETCMLHFMIVETPLHL